MVLRLLRVKPSAHCLKANYSSKKKTHYESLGVRVGATHNEIKAAYYKLSLQYHPDKDSSIGAKERFQEISSAYEVLSNHDLKKQYDLRMRTMQEPNFNRQEQKFTSNETNTYTQQSKLYDFEEWQYHHYGRQLNRAIERKEKYKIFMEHKLNKQQEQKSGRLHIFFCCLIVGIMILNAIHHSGGYDQPITHKPEHKSK